MERIAHLTHYLHWAVVLAQVEVQRPNRVAVGVVQIMLSEPAVPQ
jgi:hypothetical protein